MIKIQTVGQSELLQNQSKLLNYIIEFCMRYNLMEKGLLFFNKFLEIGFEPNGTTYSLLIKLYGKLDNEDKSFELFDNIKNNFKLCNYKVYVAVLDLCSKSSN